MTPTGFVIDVRDILDDLGAVVTLDDDVELPPAVPPVAINDREPRPLEIRDSRVLAPPAGLHPVHDTPFVGREPRMTRVAGS